MPEPNLLLGNGEVLMSARTRPSGGGRKTYPYSIDRARERLGPQIDRIVKGVEALPRSAKPRGEGVALLTVHPAFVAKTLMPRRIFASTGLRAVGSRRATVLPEHDARKNASLGQQPTAELYVAGSVSAFSALKELLIDPTTTHAQQCEFRGVEAVRILTPAERLLHLDGSDSQVDIEIVLHGDGDDDDLLLAFDEHAGVCGAVIQNAKRLSVPRLIFMPGRAPRERLAELALFSALRAVRRLPQLRMSRPTTRHRLTCVAPQLPDLDAIDDSVAVAVLDGGLGANDFARWAREVVPPELASTNSNYLSHGTEVTAALLFGVVDNLDAPTLAQPPCRVTHHRVIGAADAGDRIDLYDCMQRIDKALRQGNYEFANLSIGPRMPVSDEQPHAWTSMLDNHLASGRTLLTVAVGNDGLEPDGVGRIQPPADAVNALAVGSANSNECLWDRAEYSCYGPGRSPGVVKPDGIVFGGTDAEPLKLVNPFVGGVTGVQGTSYSAPLALRTAVQAHVCTETPLSATALRALMVHRCERTPTHKVADVGWGRFPWTAEELLTCPDHEATVLYQGVIRAGKIVRAKLPIPPVPMGVRLRLTATFCFASPVDASDPVNYTQRGFSVVFRPRGDGSTATFFGHDGYASEQDLRRNAAKWETLLHASHSFKAEDLVDVFFDIEHGARARGLPVANKRISPLPYVLIVSITADSAQPIYNAVRARYQQLQPIRLRESIRLRSTR